MSTAYDNCVSVTPECPVEATSYGYYPSLGANAFFVAFFATCFFANLGLGIKYRTWSYMVAMVLVTLTETIGYAGRIMLHNNPWDDTGFIMQICCIIIGPAFNSAAIYLTLKHVCLTFGSEWSRINPMLYTYIFITCDVVSLVLQAIGGALASTANDQTQLKTGDDLAMAGIAWQVAVLAFFGLVTIDYVLRRKRTLGVSPLSINAQAVLSNKLFQAFAAATVLAYITVFTRCVYRIIEFAGGWGNPIMQDEPSFTALEGVMIVIATLCQTACHPGYFFPALSFKKKVIGSGVTTEKYAFDEESHKPFGVPTANEMDSRRTTLTT